MKTVAKEVPTEDMRTVVEGVMASVWGGISDEQEKQLTGLIGEWALRDPDGALGWARSLRQPQQREAGLVSIAAAVGSSDPKAGFDIYAELEEVSTPLGSRALSIMMRTLYNRAAGEGPSAVLDILKRTPENKTKREELVDIDYPDGFDFKALIDGMNAIESPEGKPFGPNNPLGVWALRDADGAFDHAIREASEGRRADLTGMLYPMERKMGVVEARRWLGEKVVSLPAKQRMAVLENSNLASSPELLREYIARMPSTEAATEFRDQVVDFSVKRNFRAGMAVLDDVPDVEEKLSIIERLRGVKDSNMLRAVLNGWKVPPDRIDRILGTVTQPAESGEPGN